MAKAHQRGDRQIKGTVGQTTYKRGKKGSFTATQKVESNAPKIASHPSYQRTRENGLEFGRAGLSGKLIRDGIRSMMRFSGDGTSTARLLTTLLRIIKEDPINDRGKRTVADGPVEMLEGFDFNPTAQFNIILPVPFTTKIDRVSGVLQLDIPGFIPQKVMRVPPGATHFKINIVAMELDFKEGSFVADGKSSGNQPWSNELIPDISLISHVTPNSDKVLFLVVGLEFDQLVNGKYYSITSSDFNSMKVLKVSGGA